MNGHRKPSLDWRGEEKGAALIAAFAVLVGLTIIALAFVTMVSDDIKNAGAALIDAKAYYVAEAGLAKARWALTTDGQSVGWGESDISFGAGTYTVTTTDNGDSTYTIVSEGYVPNDTNPLAKRRVEERNISTTTSGLTNLSLTATASASSYKGVDTPDKANDGQTSTKWRADGIPSAGSPQWLAMDLGIAQTFDRVAFDEPSGNKITTYQIQSSSDGTSWSAVSNAVETINGSVTTVNFDAVTVRYHRIYITASTRRDPSIAEYETYNSNEIQSIILGQGKFVTSW